MIDHKLLSRAVCAVEDRHGDSVMPASNEEMATIWTLTGHRSKPVYVSESEYSAVVKYSQLTKMGQRPSLKKAAEQARHSPSWVRDRAEAYQEDRLFCNKHLNQN